MTAKANPLPSKYGEFNFPRRAVVDALHGAEQAIRNAMMEVEKLGADPLLTDAGTKLIAAKDLVSDWLEGKTGLAAAPVAAQEPMNIYRLAAHLPGEVNWGEPITPNMVRHILSYASSQPAQGEPVAPVGYKLVPIEPTQSMVIDGFEQTFEFEQSEEYDEMSGCEGAAQSARVCYAAMLAAAPETWKVLPSQAEVDGEFREVMTALFYELEARDKWPSPGNAPGHAHSIPGIWDSDNIKSGLAGKPCAWCAVWNKAKALKAAGHLGTPTGEPLQEAKE